MYAKLALNRGNRLPIKVTIDQLQVCYVQFEVNLLIN